MATISVHLAESMIELYNKLDKEMYQDKHVPYVRKIITYRPEDPRAPVEYRYTFGPENVPSKDTESQALVKSKRHRWEDDAYLELETEIIAEWKKLKRQWERKKEEDEKKKKKKEEAEEEKKKKKKDNKAS